jgi:hypothetical protein
MYINTPKIENCVALNSSVSAVDTGTGGALKAFRIAGKVDGAIATNIAWSSMPITGGAVNDKTASGQEARTARQHRRKAPSPPSAGTLPQSGKCPAITPRSGGERYEVLK